MLHKNSVWQSSFSNWQPLFIRENLLPLGHTAWQGFLSQGRGMVVCSLAVEDILSINWSLDLVEYKAYFLAESEMAGYLQLLNLESREVAILIDRVQNYNPETELLLLINQNGRIEINLLQNMAVSPIECHRQLEQRQSEFQLDHFSSKENL
ncbi:MAG TPA: hypothetical protein ACFCUY_06940 [Xenococcaceae cyanobacterium]|jgi:hypothetical protein